MAERSNSVVLVVDEIHHLNKSQQDIFLPHMESGRIILLGTTTENPSFELRPALLSRCKVRVFERLSLESLEILLQRAETFLKHPLPVNTEARQALCAFSDGDGRYLLNRVEELLMNPPDHNLTPQELEKRIEKRSALYDRAEGHYNLISALHKSMRGSDVNAALYWLARMFQGGEDPLFIVRRIIRFAVEDVGLADPQALIQAVAAQQAYSFLGSPEGELALVQAVIYVTTAPKSNAAYKAQKDSMALVKKNGSFPPPKSILNAPTSFMKDQGYGKDYAYDHDYPNAFSGQNYFPESLSRIQLYFPTSRGFENEIQKRLEWWANLRIKKPLE
jgi:putative ATPase